MEDKIIEALRPLNKPIRFKALCRKVINNMTRQEQNKLAETLNQLIRAGIVDYSLKLGYSINVARLLKSEMLKTENNIP